MLGLTSEYTIEVKLFFLHNGQKLLTLEEASMRHLGGGYDGVLIRVKWLS